jgi:hypothetical protein
LPPATNSVEDGAPLLRKLGSFQVFVRDATSSEDYGASRFPVEEVQKIALLDMRLLNLDRTSDNILVRHEMRDAPASGGVASTQRRPRKVIVPVLIPIDHGYTLPSDLGVAWLDWGWLSWPQVRGNAITRYIFQ